jgi:hypothetical protein
MLIEKWHPFTHDFGLIKAPFDVVVAEYVCWKESIGIGLARREITSCLSDAFEALAPLSPFKQRHLFVQTQSDWVAFYQNGIQGSDPFPAMSLLAGRMNVLAMRVCSGKGMYPANIWEVYAPESLGGTSPNNYLRSVGASNDDAGWTFDQSGAPFDFENLTNYEKNRKKDRFTREMLCEYLGHFSIEPFSDKFLCVEPNKPAVLLQRINLVPGFREYSLDEVVEGAPWRRE